MQEGMTTGRPAHMMSFTDAVKSVLQKSFTLQGRASRSEYWWFILFYNIMFIATFAIDISMGTPTSLLMLLLIPGIFCVMCRRMHDLDKSGWLILVTIIPLIGSLIVLYWFVSEGTEGPNYYGEVPTNTL